MKRTQFCSLVAMAGFATAVVIPQAEARQNIVVGDLSVRYDHQDRTYEQEGALTVIPVGSGEEAVVAPGDEDAAPVQRPAAIILDDREGDRRNFIFSPRLTFTSTGVTDLVELTYAPGVNYDDIDGTTDIDHDFGLRLEKNLSRNWLITLNNSFFLGDDPVRQEEMTAAAEADGEPEEPVVGSPAEDTGQGLTERYGRRRYWTNTLDVGTEYGYGRDRNINLVYTYDILRNDTDAGGGYSEYDRHTGDLLVHHRFNAKWSAEGEINYSKGLFDDTEVYMATPPQPEEGLEAEETTVGDEPAAQTPEITPVPLGYSQDLDEYDLRLRGGYDYSPHLHTFTEYSYLATDYASPLQYDYRVHNVAVGFDYDLSRHWHITLSGGPSWGSFDNSSTEMDYNAHGGLTWEFLHGSATLFVDKSYDQSNFDGRRSGLTDAWETGISADYQLTESLTATVSANYTNNRRLEYPVPETVVLVGDDVLAGADEVPAEEFNRILYREKDYNAGFSLNYSFWRWYTVSTGYRYYKHDSDLSENGADSYHEHRAFIELSYSNELFRW